MCIYVSMFEYIYISLFNPSINFERRILPVFYRLGN